MSKLATAYQDDDGPNPVDIHVGQRIRMRRLMQGVTQTQLADELDLTFQQVQKYEKGTNRVSASRLYAICKILSVPPEYFFEGLPKIGEPRRAKSHQTEEASVLGTADGIELMRSFRKIEEKPIRRHIVGLVKAVSAEIGTVD